MAFVEVGGTYTRGSSLNGSRASVSIPRIYSIHSLGRTKVTLIYRHTGSLRAVQVLGSLEHRRHLGIEVDDAFAIAERADLRVTLGRANASPPDLGRFCGSLLDQPARLVGMFARFQTGILTT
jgi:hypothetical protein